MFRCAGGGKNDPVAYLVPRQENQGLVGFENQGCPGKDPQREEFLAGFWDHPV
jgi:hypothetical protein